MDYNVNSMIADNIEEKIGKISHTTGKKHTFLGIDINFVDGKKFIVYTLHHVDDGSEEFDETLKGNVVNTATSQLSTITSEAKELDDEKMECYDSITANILWIMKSSRKDLETSVSFLCTRVQCPKDED